MNDRGRTTNELNEELARLRREVAELRARAERLESLLAAAPLAIHQCDTQGRITYVNPAQEAVTGYAADELLGTRVWERIAPGPERDAIPAYFQRLVAEQPSPTPYLTQNIRKNGEVFDIRIDWNYLRDAEGRVTGFVSFVADVTEQNRAEAARRQIEERYRTLAEATTDIVYIVDREGALLYANRAAAERIGIDAAALVGKRQQDLFPPEVARVHLERIARVFESGEIGENDELYRFGPHEVWLNIRSIPLRDEQGRVAAMMGVCRDITRRKRAEEALCAERNRAQQYLDVAAVVMVALDDAGNITLLNRRGHEILGHPDGSLLGKNWFQACVPERVRSEVLSAFRELMAGELAPVEYYENPVITRAGEERIIAWHNALLTDADGRVTGTLSSGIDVTERKLAEQRSRESEKRFREAMEATSDGLWDWNVETGDVYYSPAYFHMLGYDDSEHAPNVESWADLLHPDDRAEALRVNQDCIEGRVQHFQVEFRMRTKDGAWKHILGRGKALQRDARGRATRMIGTHVDITDRKRIQAELQRARDELERRVAERTAELAESEAKYRHLVEATDTGFLIVDGEGRVVDANAEYVRLTGRQSFDDIRGRTVLEWTAPHDVERNAREVAKCQETGFVRQLEIDYIGPDGRILPIVVNASVVHTKHGPQIVSLCHDITERKRAAQELQQSRDELQAAYDGMRDGLLIADIETKRFVRANAAICRMLGYSEEQVLSLSVADIHPPADLPAVIEVFDAQAAGLAVLVAELPVLHADGRVFYADIASNRIVYNGRDCLMGVFRDVTDRRQAAQELRQSRDELQTIYDQMMDGIIIVDAEKVRAIQVNPAYCRMVGYSAEEMKTTSPENLHPPAAFPQVLEHFAEVRRAGVARIENLPFIRKDGGLVYADVVSTSVSYQDHPCWFSFFHDVTDRHKADEALRQSEERYRGVVEASPDAVVMSDLEGRVVFASRQTWRLLGLPETEALAGRSIFDYVVEADREGLAANLAELVQAGLRRNTHYTALRADGTTVPVEASSVLIRDPQGRPQLAMAVIRDITDRRRAQNALERQRRTLELMLQASDHERRTIAYDIHDGLAQQLAGAIMQFQIHDYAKESNPEQAAKAYRGGVSLLQQGHAEARRIISGVRPPILDESGVVAAIAHLVHDPSVAHGPKVEFYSNTQFGRLPSIFENAIYRIAQEGLSNACKHSQSPKVRVSLVERGGRVRIEIRDWGIGFNPRKMKKNRFGLPGIRERARLLGGKCRVRSAPGEGACITVDLPLPPELPEEE